MSKIVRKFAFLLLAALLLHPIGAWSETFPLPEKSSRPTLWTADETALTLSLLAGGAFISLFDEPIRRRLQKNRGADGDTVADTFAFIGHPVVVFGLSGLVWGAGKWQGDPYGEETGILALEALTLSQIASLSLKGAIGRERPDSGDDADNFQPLSMRDSRHSFPSSHTSGAFALASVLSRRSEAPYAPLGYYGVATMVGLSRLYQDKHWASDVVAGALIGELSARLVLNWHLRKNSSLTITPYAAQRVGVMATMVW